jgi:hypothetical protein
MNSLLPCVTQWRRKNPERVSEAVKLVIKRHCVCPGRVRQVAAYSGAQEAIRKVSTLGVTNENATTSKKVRTTVSPENQR